MNEKHNLQCPYCGGIHTEERKDDDGYVCKDCDSFFYFEDIVREPIRQRISRICSHHYADESNPHPCNILIANRKFSGLDPIETPRVVGVFMTEDGIIYFNIEGLECPIEFDEMWTDDLQIINVEL